MDQLTEDSVPENCIILSPEDLVKLGVKIENSSLPSSSENDLNLKQYAKKPNITESTAGAPTNRHSKTTKIRHTHKGRPSQIKSLNSKKNKLLDSSDQHRYNRNETHNIKTSDANVNNKCSDNNKGTENVVKGNAQFLNDNEVTNEQAQMLIRRSKDITTLHPENKVCKDYRLFPLDTNGTVETTASSTDCIFSVLESSISNTQAQKDEKGGPTKSLPLVVNEKYVAVSTIKAPLGEDLDTSYGLESLNGDGVKSEKPDNTKFLLHHATGNSNSSSENKVCELFPPVADKNSNLKDALNAGIPEIVIKASNAGIQNRGRGIPKKCRPKESFDIRNAMSPHLIPDNYPATSDLRSDSNSDTPSKIMTKKRKRGRPKNKQIIDSDTSFNSDICSFTEKFKSSQTKIEGSDMKCKLQVARDDKINDRLEYISNESVKCEENKVPKKISLEENKTFVSDTSIYEHREIDDSVVSSNLNSENKVCKDFPPVSDTNSNLEDPSSPSVSNLSIKPTSNFEVQKRRRGRPKKSLPLELNKNVDIEDASFLNLLHHNDETNISSKISFDNAFDFQDTKSKKGRRIKPKSYKALFSDLNSNSDSVSDGDSNSWKPRTKRKKRARCKNKQIIDNDTSRSSSEERIPSQKPTKIEESDMQYKSKVIFNDVVNAQLEIIESENINCKQTNIPKKRGRPKKKSLEANETITSGITMYEHSEKDDAVVVTSKRGRKRKEVNYLLLENPHLFESDNKIVNNQLCNKSLPCEENKVPRRRGKPKKNSPERNIEEKERTDLSEDIIKIEAPDIQYLSHDSTKDGENTEMSFNTENENYVVTENDCNSTCGTLQSTRYKWTGNVTKAIKQMFNAIQDKNIDDLGDDPLLGKTKRKGRAKANADDLLDEGGTSVCMVCNETMPNPEWSKHKRKIHYNLTWRKGDTCLDLTNETTVLSTLKQLIELKGFIKCNKCAAKIKNAKKFVNHLEICNGIVNSSGCLTCAVCKATMEKNAWQYHNYRQHNNLAWRDGEPPLNLEDQDFVLRILNGLYKARKPLHCEQCGLQKKSVLGFLSHKSTCQKTQNELDNLKVACRLCSRKVLPVSMDYHLKAHEKQKELQDTSVGSDYFDVNIITEKRRAAKHALKVINSIRGQAVDESKYYISQCNFQDNFVDHILRKKLVEHSPLQCIFADCNFSADLVESITNHMNSCEKKPEQYFVCKVCLSLCKEEWEIHEHIRAEHNKSFKGNEDMEFQAEGVEYYSEEDEFVENEEREKKRLRFKEKQKIINHSNIKVKPIFLNHPIRETPSSLLYQQAYVWMLEFCETNYNKFNIYQYLRIDQPWQVLHCDVLNDYLPKNYQSCDIAAKIITTKENPKMVTELNFRRLDLFEVGDFYEGDVTIFCGGPISALAWLPTPYDQKSHNQILAVAVLNNMESYYSIDKNYHEPCIIQFWDFGLLDCHQKYVSKPSLLFGMALTCSPIWHLEWCPSGCLDCFEEDTTCRLGLLAAAASDSFVYIYSIDNIRDPNDSGIIYKGEPVLKLQLEYETSTLEGQCYYPTKISWTKAANHRYIAVGYSTGLIALYDLLNESILLKRGDQTGTNTIFPYKTFQGHYSSITALSLSHMGNGSGWLFSASFDRTSVFWDLDTMTKLTSYKRNTVADGIWLTQWPTSLVVDDESSYNDKALAHSYFKAIRHLMSPDGTNFTFAASGIRALSYSDWLNTILHGSNAGEVMAQFTHRMFFGIENKMFKSSYIRCIFSVAKLVKKNRSENLTRHLAVTYNEAAEKYSLAFLDYSLDKISNTLNTNVKTGLKPESVSPCDITEYSLQSINKIVCNPNPQACSFYAVGYQAGFVRLQGMQFLSLQLPK